MVMILCSRILLVRGEERASEITVTKSARFDELGNIGFCGVYSTAH